RRRHTRFSRDWSSDVCSSDLTVLGAMDVYGITTIQNTTNSNSKDDGALIVEGGVGIEGNLNIGGRLGMSSNTTGFVMSLENTNTSEERRVGNEKRRQLMRTPV